LNSDFFWVVAQVSARDNPENLDAAVGSSRRGESCLVLERQARRGRTGSDPETCHDQDNTSQQIDAVAAQRAADH
jgi:hypothetical protein